MGYYIHCPRCGEETLDDGTLTCCNNDCKWYEGKEAEEKIAALEAQVREREAECERKCERCELRRDIAVVEARAEAAEKECGRLRAELAGSEVNVRELWSRVTVAESALAAAREENEQLRNGIVVAMEHAANRWSEWGERAVTVADMLDAALDGCAALRSQGTDSEKRFTGNPTDGPYEEDLDKRSHASQGTDQGGKESQ